MYVPVWSRETLLIVWRNKLCFSLESLVADGIIVLFSRTVTVSPSRLVHCTKVGSFVVRTLQLRTTFCPTSYVKFGVMMVTVIIEFASVWGIAPEVAVTTANINCDKRLSSLCNCKKVDDETHFYLGGAPSREIEFARFCYMVAVKVGIGC